MSTESIILAKIRQADGTFHREVVEIDVTDLVGPAMMRFHAEHRDEIDLALRAHGVKLEDLVAPNWSALMHPSWITEIPAFTDATSDEYRPASPEGYTLRRAIILAGLVGIFAGGLVLALKAVGL